MTKENSVRAVSESELDELKQQAMEIALRVHVIQGGNLLDDTHVEKQEKKNFSELKFIHKIMMLSIVIGPIALLYSITFKENTVLFLYFGTLLAIAIYNRLSSHRIKK